MFYFNFQYTEFKYILDRQWSNSLFIFPLVREKAKRNPKDRRIYLFYVLFVIFSASWDSTYYSFETASQIFGNMFRRRSFYNSTDLFKMNTKFSELLLLIKFLVLTNAIIDFSTNSKENSSPVFRRWPLLEDLDCSRILAGDKVYIEKISSHPEKRIRLRQESSLNWSDNFLNCKFGSDNFPFFTSWIFA